MLIEPIFLEAGVLLLGVFLLLFEAFANEKDKTVLAWGGIAGLALVFVLTFFTAAPDAVSIQHAYNAFYKADAAAMFFKRLALITTIVVLIMSLEYREVIARYIYGSKPGAGLGEFFALPVLTCAGLMWMASANDFIFIFVSLELVTISFYVLVAYMRRNVGSLEAGVKYLILSALSTGFLVYGITWIFGTTGQTNLDAIRVALQSGAVPQIPVLFGFMLVTVALGFKIAAAPFQLWVPDVYQGAPTPVTAFLSVGSKAAGFIVLMRVIDPFLSVPVLRDKVIGVLVVLAVLTLLYGNLAAIPQENFKRLLAYSSIGHAGYLLVALASIESPTAGVAVSFYLAAYLLMTLLSFVVMIAVANNAGGDDVAHFNGLGKRSPLLAFGMLIAVLSLAGIPFTVGFVGKFLVFYAAIEQQQYLLVGIGVIAVGAGFYYYLKVVRAMYWESPQDDRKLTIAPLTKLTVGVLAALILVLGVFPRPVLSAFGGEKGNPASVNSLFR